MMILPLLFVGICRAAGPNALIVSDTTPGPEQSAVTNLTAALTSAGYTVTDVTSVPGTIAVWNGTTGYKQVWDIRFDLTVSLAGAEAASYNSYLSAGGRLFIGGEDVVDAASRDANIAAFVTALGGGTITPAAAGSAESVLPPFTTTPDSVTSIVFNNAAGSQSAGTGSFINKDTSPADGYGAGILWPAGSLSTALLGTLIVVFDEDFINSTGDPNSVAYLANLIGYLNLPGPYITSLTPNSGPVGSTVVIAGGNFGATQSGGTVRFNGTLVTSVLSWSNTSITVIVPAGTTTGNVVVPANAELSNGVLFTISGSPIQVPTLSDGAMVLLACCLMAIAAWRIRRSHRSPAI
jgi:hypothetical protein